MLCLDTRLSKNAGIDDCRQALFLLQTAQSVFMATFPTFQTQRRATTYIFAEPENYM
jgi:hypothetical protein